jgi:hypothetical protein
VSDHDFFFDDDEPKPAKSTKAASGKAKASGSSAKPAPRSSSAKPAPRGSSAKPATRGSGAVKNEPGASAPSGAFMDQSIGMPIASLLVVIGLLVGVIVGFFMGGAAQSQSPAIGATGAVPAATYGSTVGGASTTTTPGQLTPAQIQQGLPAGHPAISGSTGASSTTAP